MSDNAFFHSYILGDTIVRPYDIPLEEVGLTVYHNGIQSLSGTGAGVMGHPAEGVIWLANRMLDVGMPLQAGELILSGSFTGGILAAPGDAFEAVYSHGLGCVRVVFEKEA